MKKTSYIAIVVALHSEFDINSVKHKKIIVQNQTFYVVNNKFVILFSGVGKANAASLLTFALANFPIKQIINLGTAAKLREHLDILSVNLVHACQYGDVDVTCDPDYMINQIPYEPKTFLTSQQDLINLQLVLQSLNYSFVSGINTTIDSFITKNNKHHFHEIDNQAIYTLDMECAALAQVAHKFSTPFNSIKIITDNPLIDNNHDSFMENIKKARIMINKIILALIN